MTNDNGPRAILVTGGARSGKSRFAERLVMESGLEKVYVATGAAHDGEMAERIAAHRGRRGADWQTVEEELDLEPVLRREARPGRAILVDCLTLWLSNLLFAERDVASESARLCETVSALAGPCIFVTNEVGMGIVPDNRLSRSFRDAQGRLNQDMAEACGKVVLVAAGQPLLLKPSSQPEFRL
ncbi:MAG: bifunctional adenosylcobinamide kinase/adenosylcobinamide-phosphate guanylyltransferase [Roseibium sp.]